MRQIETTTAYVNGASFARMGPRCCRARDERDPYGGYRLPNSRAASRAEGTYLTSWVVAPTPCKILNGKEGANLRSSDQTQAFSSGSVDCSIALTLTFPQS